MPDPLDHPTFPESVKILNDKTRETLGTIMTAKMNLFFPQYEDKSLMNRQFKESFSKERFIDICGHSKSQYFRQNVTK